MEKLRIVHMVLISGFWGTIFQIENMKPVLYNALKIPSLTPFALFAAERKIISDASYFSPV